MLVRVDHVKLGALEVDFEKQYGGHGRPIRDNIVEPNNVGQDGELLGTDVKKSLANPGGPDVEVLFIGGDRLR